MKYKSILAICVALMLAGCGQKADTNVEDQVAKALTESQEAEGAAGADATESGSIAGTDNTTNDGESVDGSDGKSDKTVNSISGANSGDDNDAVGGTGDDSSLTKTDGAATDKNTASNTSGKTSSGKTSTGKTSTGKTSTKKEEIPKYSTNPFLGNLSTATSYDIKFSIATDSGIAGFTWGSEDGTDGEYYLWAIDCTRDFPKLYTSRRKGNDVWDEEYTNLDIMYPEMVMFTGNKHYLEIVVNGTKVTTLLDSVQVAETTIASAKPIGQIGTWVMKGNYHATFDDLFIAEGTDGSGTYLYSEDFSKKKHIFYPFLENKSGELYAESGYYTVLPTEAKNK